MPTGPNRQSTIQRIAIRIDEVDIPNRAVHGYDKTNVLVIATFRETPNGVLYIPAQNERWIAERQGQGHWRLVTRLDSADQQAYVESTLGPGDMRIAAENIYFTGTVHGAGGGGGSVTSVTAGDASIVIGGTTAAPTVETADLSTISLLHPAVGDVSANSRKIINLTPGVLGTDAATVSQIPTSFPPSGAAGGDLTGTYPNPTIGTITGHSITFHDAGTHDVVLAHDLSSATVGALSFTAAGWPYLEVMDTTAGGAGILFDADGTDGTHQASYEMYVPHADRGIHFFHDGTGLDFLRLREDAGGAGLPGIVFGDTVTDTKLWRASAGVLASNASFVAVTLSPSGLTGATGASRYVGATASGAPASGTFAVGDFVIAQDGGIWVCTGAGSPGTWKETGAVGNLVTSVFGRTGAVTAQTGDYTAAQVGALGATAAAGGSLAGNYPNPTIASSVNLPGNPTTTTQTATDSSTKIATTAFVHAAIAADSVVRIQITQTSHGFSVGNVLYYTGSAYALAKADNADDAEVVGIVATVVDANNFILQAVGEVTGLSGLTAGTTYFLSDATAGLLTATAPTANGSILKPLGIAVSTTVLFFYNWRGEIISAAASFPTVTTSAFSGGPPSSPSDGDIWMASGVDTNGTRWQFQYNAGSSSAYKWEFVGGPPMIQQDSTRTARLVGSNSAWLAVPGISNIVTARGGDYITHVTGWMQGSVGSTTYCGVGLTGGSDPNIHYISENASNSISQAAHGVQTGIAANSTWKLFMFTSDFTTASITDPAFSIIPVRVS